MENILTRSQIPEVGSLLKRMIALYEQTELNDLALQAMFTEIKASFDNLSTAIQRDDAVSQLAELDDQRDDICRGLYYDIKNAADALLDTFEKYGLEIVKMSYSIESSKIASLLGELKNEPENVKALPGLQTILTALEEAQNTFEQERIIYEKAKTADNKTSAPHELKKQAILLINGKLNVYLKAMAMVNEALYGEFADNLTTMIKESNNNVRQRSKKAEEELV